ncbi:MAG: 6-phosphofructokinase, partial [Chloroflexota bacterium]
MRTLVCVSGGDAPGINTLIARLSVLAAGNGDVVLGADGGFAGIFDEQIDVVDRRIVRRLDGRGGTLYASTREPVLAAEDAGERLKAILKKHKIDNIVLFG